jgi:conjugal transfer pilus assembly protein TraV
MNDILLRSAKMLTSNPRLATLTNAFVAGLVLITKSPARTLSTATKAFDPASTRGPALRSPRRRMHKLSRTGAAILSSAVALSGCTTLGGNVKGSFACRAPDGMCAPTSKIDDQALAMISGGEPESTPTGVIDPKDRANPRLSPVTASAVPTRSSEKILRIVFPAHVDRLGRYREASAIHAVVERGAWMTAADARTATLVGMTAPSAPQLAIAELVPSLAELAASSPEVAFPQGSPDQANPAPAEQVVAARDPNVPSVAAIAAARRKGRSEKNRTSTVRTFKATNRALETVAVGPHMIRTVLQSAPTLSPAKPTALITPRSIVPAQPSRVPVALQTTSVSPPVTAASGAPFDLRATGTLSPLQSIREQVGSILAARAVIGRTTASSKLGVAERPLNGPSILAVSGVEK